MASILNDPKNAAELEVARAIDKLPKGSLREGLEKHLRLHAKRAKVQQVAPQLNEKAVETAAVVWTVVEELDKRLAKDYNFTLQDKVKEFATKFTNVATTKAEAAPKAEGKRSAADANNSPTSDQFLAELERAGLRIRRGNYGS